MKKIVRLGTRGSPLALIQAELVRNMIYAANDPERTKLQIDVVPIRTSGDWNPGTGEKSFLELGGNKGLFTKEIEDSLLDGSIDCAVHSMKDVSVYVPDGLIYAAMPLRADPRDAFMCAIAPTLDDLPAGARIGTSSLRRKAQILAARPDVSVIPLRGNVDTRMKKLAAEEADATVLAVAGLTRLGVPERAASIFDTSVMLPAAAQGLLGIQTRQNDEAMIGLVTPVNHRESSLCGMAERALLRQLDGSCRTPIGALADVRSDGTLFLEALVAKHDGKQIIRRYLSGPADDATRIGDALGEQMKAEIPSDFFAC